MINMTYSTHEARPEATLKTHIKESGDAVGFSVRRKGEEVMRGTVFLPEYTEQAIQRAKDRIRKMAENKYQLDERSTWQEELEDNGFRSMGVPVNGKHIYRKQFDAEKGHYLFHIVIRDNRVNGTITPYANSDPGMDMTPAGTFRAIPKELNDNAEIIHKKGLFPEKDPEYDEIAISGRSVGEVYTTGLELLKGLVGWVE